MQSLIVVLVLALGLFQAVESATDAENVEACRKDSKLTPDEIKLTQPDRLYTKMTTPPSKNLQCYVLCVYKKFGLVGADDKANFDAIIKYINNFIKDEAKAKKTIETCRSVKGADMCETLFNLEKCITEHYNDK